ncbi:hypothetical protein [Candidatus Cryosericum septentrionale]|jgi:O-antigen ligase|uniref:DUF4405 domain-containing protein n=1 Tax=Candidatus Cryosericum septentrionale TaxID=2290913 RepID=A0A398DIC3_9BACT|nr:hypothetical protein [Candidatus Cryosericum septentrionale]RIE15396.1 hypothetical protein SMC1_10275 [Candidatus Cryosericum septentrionale]
MSVVQKAIGIGLLYLLTIGTGIWVSNSGQPLNILIFTIHKLIALATVVLTIILFRGLLKNVQTGALLLGLMIASAVLVIALFVTGAMFSTGKPVNDLLLTVHRVAPVLLAVSTGVGVYLLIK